MRYFEKVALETAVVTKNNNESKKYLQAQGFQSVDKKTYLQKDEELSNKNVDSINTATKVNKFTRRMLGGFAGGALGSLAGVGLSKVTKLNPAGLAFTGAGVGAAIGAAATSTKGVEERGKLLTEKYLLHRAAVKDRISKDNSKEYFVRE